MYKICITTPIIAYGAEVLLKYSTVRGTEVHNFHPGIIISDYFRLLQVLLLNASWNYFIIISGTYKQISFFVLILNYHQSVFID
jgi:hypothetical protein